uniref:SUI1 domain-containing protein n=1 Tax=Echinococcus granulosus TaxID=6210 RepID=A0A068X4X7_ECHGR|nr:hypothetical protein EgrG_002058500 [Echinococcus granulosus]
MDNGPTRKQSIYDEPILNKRPIRAFSAAIDKSLWDIINHNPMYRRRRDAATCPAATLVLVPNRVMRCAGIKSDVQVVMERCRTGGIKMGCETKKTLVGSFQDLAVPHAVGGVIEEELNKLGVSDDDSLQFR